MLKVFLQKLLVRFGKSYTLDESISNKLVIRFLLDRVIMIIRGIIKTGRKVFIGRKVTILNKSNIEFGQSCTIESYVSIDCFAASMIKFGSFVKIGKFSKISTTSHLSKLGKGLTIGNNSAVGEFSFFGCSGGVRIGEDVIMGQYISFHSENHNFYDKDNLIRKQGVTSKGIELGNNIWVGSKVTFLDGCVLGNNIVVAAGSVVKGEFPSNVLIGGVPAKVLKHIYD